MSDLETKFPSGTVGVVIRPHKASYPDALIITAGDLLQGGRQDETWPLYRWVTNKGGVSGWVPEIYLEPVDKGWVAKQDYSTEELTVEIGDQLLVSVEVGGWVLGELSSKARGWIPRDHLKILPIILESGDSNL